MFGNGNPLLHLLDKLSQNRLVGKFVTLASVLFFLVFVLGPLFFVFFKLSSFKYLPEMENALIVSFSLAFYVTLADLVFGIPVAWLLAKKNFPFKELFDTLIDLPLVIPTSALGLSVALMWGSSGLGVFNPGFEVLFLLHVAFTFPYVVRTAQASIMTIDTDLGRAAQSLGASPFTIFRNVWMPLSKPGIISGSILAFTRSLGETGASILVAGAIKTVPVLTVFYKNSTPADIDAAISISAILIAVSAFIFLFARSSIDSKKSGLGKIFVDAERRISGYSGAGMVAGVLFFAAIVLLPSFFFLKYTDANFLSKDILEAITISFAIGLSATILSIALGLPFAMYLASKGLGSRLFKLVNEMCMLMPTVTIGISLSLFWA
ncbi:ABC transporter permease subunit, partial [Candidatus Parvarchaeota archaeon]|nr:ABC transporter permease subunit [Candidatus Parvarchaeota archaeon]